VREVVEWFVNALVVLKAIHIALDLVHKIISKYLEIKKLITGNDSDKHK
jgi:cytochrome b